MCFGGAGCVCVCLRCASFRGDAENTVFGCALSIFG